MERMSTPETILRSSEQVRPLKRVEYERLAAEGFFDDEKVELLFGMVVPMSPTDPAHHHSGYRIRRLIEQALRDRAYVRDQSAFAASDVSEPQPDLAVVPAVEYWQDHPNRAFLIVEVARSSLRKDKGPKVALYGLAEVDEYWIVNHVDDVVEVYRDRHNGEWRQRTTHMRGDTIAMLAFPDVQVAVGEILPPVEPR
jgi:Uma2 family endonuclease